MKEAGAARASALHRWNRRRVQETARGANDWRTSVLRTQDALLRGRCYWTMGEQPGKPAPSEFLAIGGDKPDAKRVAFRVMGAGLDPDTITRATGLSPHLMHRKGQARPPSLTSGRTSQPWPSGMWLLESSMGLPERGNGLDDHVTWLLDLLEPSAGRIRQLVAEQSLTTDFYCGYFMGQSNSSLALRARTLGRVAALDADVVFDVYGESAERELEYWLNAEPGK
jgi:Domain of unknown function (DUF4279)